MSLKKANMLIITMIGVSILTGCSAIKDTGNDNVDVLGLLSDTVDAYEITVAKEAEQNREEQALSLTPRRPPLP